MAGYFDRLINQGNQTNAEPDLLQQNNQANQQITANITDHDTRTQPKIRETSQELLKYGLLEEANKPNLYRIALSHPDEINRILEPLDLHMGIDEIRGLLYIKVRIEESENVDEWSHPLVRRQRLNLEQSLLIAILRQHFIAWEQEQGTGAHQPQIAIDDLLPQLQVYLGDPGSESKERTRLLNLLDQLKNHGLVTSPDTHDLITIRPIIAHLADPLNLQALLNWLKEQISQSISPTRKTEEDSRKEEE